MDVLTIVKSCLYLCCARCLVLSMCTLYDHYGAYFHIPFRLFILLIELGANFSFDLQIVIYPPIACVQLDLKIPIKIIKHKYLCCYIEAKMLLTEDIGFLAGNTA